MATTRSRDHVITGRTTLCLRILQLLVALSVVGLAAYGLTFLVFSGIELNMFTAAISVIFLTYLIISSTVWVVAYNYWVALFFDGFGFVFWLVSFSLLTSQVRPFYASYYYSYDGCDFYYYGRCYYKRDLDVGGDIEKRSNTNIYTYRNSMAACAALAGFQWVLFCVSFLTTIIYMYQHREAGGHAICGKPHTPAVTGETRSDVEMQPTMVGTEEPRTTQVPAPPAATTTTTPYPADDQPPR